MAKFSKGWAFVGLSVATGLALALGCGTGLDGGDTSAVDLSQSPDLVISQVYGGGGNANATFKNDFVELFNRGTAPVHLKGKTLQYTKADLSFSGATNVTVKLDDHDLAPGEYYLIVLAAGTKDAAPLPIPVAADHTQSSDVNLGNTDGKVVLVDGDPLDGCGATVDGGALCADGQWIDLVGYGAATQFEKAPAGALSNATAAIRAGNGCFDTGDNSADFDTTKVPAPHAGTTNCADAGTPPGPPDGGADADAGHPDGSTDGGKDSGTKDSGAKEGGTKDKDGGAKEAGPNRPVPEAGPGDDDDDGTTPDPVEDPGGDKTKKPAPKAPLRTGSSDCSMTPGPIDMSGGFTAAFGLALAAASLRSRRRSKK